MNVANSDMIALKPKLIPLRANGYTLLFILSTLLSGCLAMPVREDKGIYIQVAPPTSPKDIVNGKKIVDQFAYRYGYVVSLGLTQDTQAGEPLFKAFGYSGSLKKVIDYELPDLDTSKTIKALPYTFGLAKGENGRLFFDIQLQHVRDEHSPPVIQFLTAIKVCYGERRVRVERPIWTDWLLIGD